MTRMRRECGTTAYHYTASSCAQCIPGMCVCFHVQRVTCVARMLMHGYTRSVNARCSPGSLHSPQPDLVDSKKVKGRPCMRSGSIKVGIGYEAGHAQGHRMLAFLRMPRVGWPSTSSLPSGSGVGSLLLGTKALLRPAPGCSGREAVSTAISGMHAECRIA